MSRVRSIGVVTSALLMVVAGPAAAGNVVDSPGGTAFGYQFAELSRVLGPEEIGVPANATTGTADVSAVALPDGRIRLYFWRSDGSGSSQIASAVSGDGIHFTLEPGVRVNGASPFVYPLPTGGYRLFYIGNGNVVSATSSDGLVFTPDPGVRLAGNTFHAPEGYLLNCSAIAALSGGRYRMYCSQAVTYEMWGSAKIYEWAVFSAVSSDLLTWSPEPGVRIGPGSVGPLTTDASRPTLLASKPDGSVVLVFTRAKAPAPTPGEALPPTGPGHSREMVATSTDGVTFSEEHWSGLYGTEPSALTRADGPQLLYYGNHTPASGSIISVAAVTAPKAAGCTAPKVVGLTLAQARQRISAAGCSSGTVRRATSAKVKVGRVIAQEPAAGARADAGAKVNLVVSSTRR